MIYTELTGGLGNQLFMVFNILALSKKYNVPYVISYDSDYKTIYFKQKNVIRKNPTEYNIFKLINIDNSIDIDKFQIYNEISFKYDEIILDNKINYRIKGYYQSYKYFWEYIDYIRNKLYIDSNIIDDVKKNISSYGKKTMGIHIRLGDYITEYKYHGTLSQKYYKYILDKYDLSEYKIILFSDDINSAKNRISFLKNYNIILANDINNDDEYQFFLFSFCDVKICANSTYSLMSSYLNEMFKFNDSSISYFPDIWFEENGPSFNILDLIPKNDNFKIVENYVCKNAVIFFHKNINNIYEKQWVNRCIESVLNQTDVDFDIFEVNYENINYSILKDHDIGNRTHYFYKEDFDTHTEAMVFLLEKAFNKGYDYVFNTNLDDYYHTDRFKSQIEDIKLNKSVISSSLWTYVDEYNNIKNGMNSIIYINDDFSWTKFNSIEETENVDIYNKDIKMSVIEKNLLKNNNVINHSGVCFSKIFFYLKTKLGNNINYRNDKPYEDLSLWKRIVENNYTISVINKCLIYYRIHNGQIGSQNKNIDNLDHMTRRTFKKFTDMRKYRFYILFYINNIHDFEMFTKLNLFKMNKYIILYINKNILSYIYNDASITDIDNIEIIEYNEKDRLNINDFYIKYKIKLQLITDKLIFFNL